MKILVCNAGSTSLKFKLWQMPEFVCLASGRVERVGSENAIFQYTSGDTGVYREPISIPDYECGIRLFLDELVCGKGHAIDSKVKSRRSDSKPCSQRAIPAFTS